MDLRERHLTPDLPTEGHADSLRRARFFDAFDNNVGATRVPACKLFKQLNVKRPTAYRWLHERHLYGRIVERRDKFRQFKQVAEMTVGSGRPLKITDAALEKLLKQPKKQRRKALSRQLQECGIQACRETARKALKERFSAAMFKAAKVSHITKKQADWRKEYCYEHLNKPLIGFWDGVVFTDEAHCSLNDFPDDWILRIRGSRLSPDNTIEEPDRESMNVHFAAWVNYYTKAPELTFYNDEYNNEEKPKLERKPVRRPKRETTPEFKDRILVWEREKQRITEQARPGNAMCGKYYTEKLLPIYRDALDELELNYTPQRPIVSGFSRQSWFLVEDNDPSHGTLTADNIAALWREAHGVNRLLLLKTGF